MRRIAAIALLLVAGGVGAWSLRPPEAQGLVFAVPAPQPVPTSTAAKPSALPAPDLPTPVASPPDSPAPAAPVRRFRVIDAATGRPEPGGKILVAPEGIVHDAEVLLQAPDAWHRYALDRNASAILDSRFAHYRAMAVLPGRGCSEWVLIGAGSHDVILRIVPGNVLEGTLTDAATHAPLTDAEVVVQLAPPNDGAMRWCGSVSLRTDLAGRYRLVGVPPGFVVLPQIAASARVRGTVWERWSRDQPDPDGAVACGAAHRFDGTGGHAMRHLAAEVRGGRWTTLVLRFPAGQPIPAEVTLTHTCIERSSATTERGMSRTPQVRTTVISSAEWAIVERTWTRVVPLDPRAPRVRVFLVAGRNRLRVAADNRIGDVPRQDVADAGSETVVELPMRPRAQCLIRLVDEAGMPLARPDVIVRLIRSLSRAEGHGGGALERLDEGRSDSTGTTDLSACLPVLDPEPADGHEDGRHEEFHVVVVGEGLYRAEPNDDWPAARLSREALARRLAAGDPAPVVIDAVARTARPLTVRVVGPDAMPLVGVEVSAMPPTRFEEPHRAFSDSEGRVTFRCRGAGMPLDARHAEVAICVDQPGMRGTISVEDVLRYRPRPARAATDMDALRRRGVSEAVIRDQLRREAIAELAADPLPSLRVDVRRRLRLLLHDPHGVPIVGSHLSLHWRSETRETGAETGTDAAGAADLDLPGDASHLILSERGGSWFPVTVEEPPATGTVTLTAYPNVRLQARLLWPADAPAAARSTDTCWTLLDPATGGYVGYTRGGAEGDVAFMLVPGRPLRLRGGVRDGLLGADVVCDPRDGAVLDLPMVAAGPIRDLVLRFNDQDGAPLAGVEMHLWAQSGERVLMRDGTTDERGEIPCLALAGTYTKAVARIQDRRDDLEDSVTLEGVTVPGGAWTFAFRQRPR